MEEVASAQLLTSGAGAELIRTQTGRSCTRQNLEKLCKQGKLPRSCMSASPVRVRADLLVEEYLSMVDTRQTVRVKPGVKATQAAAVVVPSDAELPPYTESQARWQFERANLLELDRKEREGQLVDRQKVETTWAQVVTTVKTKLLAVPSRAKQRIPHLSLEEVEILGGLVREALEDLAMVAK